MTQSYPRYRARSIAERSARAVLLPLERRLFLHAGHDGVFINVGATASFVDAGGHTWQADAFFTDGQTKSGVYDVAGTGDDAVFAPRRFGPAFNYAIPIASAGTYRVTLLMAEPWFTGRGQRIFNVAAEGATRLANFDLMTAAATKTAVKRSFDVPVTDGTLNLDFTGVVENALVSGIAVERAAQVPTAPGGLAATAVSASRIDLRWTDLSTEETGFAIERSGDGGSTWAQIAVVNGNVTSYSNIGLSAGTTYVYRVRATSAAGASAPSTFASARTLTAVGGTRTPFGGTPVRLPGTLQAENFDNGAISVVYNDLTPGNSGGVYRDTPVDVYEIPVTAVVPGGSTSLASPQFSVGSIRVGEWLEYTVDVPQAANFSLAIRYASGSQGGSGTLLLNGQPMYASAVAFNYTGGWSRFSDIVLPARSIPAGRHVMRLSFVSVNRTGQEIGVIDWLKFTQASVGTPAPGSAPAAPASLVVRAVGDTQVNLAWTDVATDETGYRVERRSPTGWTVLTDLPAGRSWYADTTAAPSTSYEYRVTALGAGGAVATASAASRSTTTPAAAAFAWAGTTANPLARYEAAGAAANGRLFVFGGYVNTSIQASARVDAFDPARNTWTRLRDMPEVVTHAGQAVDGNFIYLAGGFVGDHPGLGSTSVWRYDTRNDSWTRMPSLPAPRGGGAMAIVKRELHFFGGLTQAQFATVNQAEHWVLDLTAPSLGWKTRAALPNARNHLAAAELDGKIYAIGGQDLWNEATGAKSNVDVFDPDTNTWAPAAPLPTPRSHVSASTFSLDGRIYVIGGATNNLVTLRDVTIYNPATNTWSAGPRLLAPRLTPVAGAIGRQLIVTTGSAFGLQPQSETFIGLLD